MIWQFLENEELTRVLLGEATERGTYSAISSFLSAGTASCIHNRIFAVGGRLPFAGLQRCAGQRKLAVGRSTRW